VEIIFVDNHLIVIDKPAGISTQSHDAPGLEEQVKNWIKNKYKKPGNVFLQPVHRLDKSVRGLVLFARTSKALSRLQEEMRNQRIEKTYFAEVEGIVLQKEATLEHYLVHEDFRARIAHPPFGKRALLSYRLLSSDLVKQTSSLEIRLQTGRYHQIRAQLSAIGHPILGDAKYGSKRSYKAGAIALHHGCLSFMHPVTREKCLFKTSN
jgi:23S rRNA pseudouridine1911/1915/1917 synthase